MLLNTFVFTERHTQIVEDREVGGEEEGGIKEKVDWEWGIMDSSIIKGNRDLKSKGKGVVKYCVEVLIETRVTWLKNAL